MTLSHAARGALVDAGLRALESTPTADWFVDGEGRKYGVFKSGYVRRYTGNSHAQVLIKGCFDEAQLVAEVLKRAAPETAAPHGAGEVAARDREIAFLKYRIRQLEGQVTSLKLRVEALPRRRRKAGVEPAASPPPVIDLCREMEARRRERETPIEGDD